MEFKRVLCNRVKLGKMCTVERWYMEKAEREKEKMAIGMLYTGGKGENESIYH